MTQRTQISDQDIDGQTAIHIACGTGNKKAVELLLKKRPEFLKDNSGKNPLEYAKEMNLPEIIRIFEKYLTEENERLQREEEYKMSPYAPCDPDDKEPTTGLLSALHIELTYMQETKILDDNQQHFDTVVDLLRKMDPVRAMRELLKFQASDISGKRYRCKLLYETLDRCEGARNEELWMTRGSHNPKIRPQMLMMTRDESNTIRMLGGKVQNGERPPGHPFLEKIFFMPEPQKVPPPEMLFSENTYVIPRAATEAKALADVKSKLDDKDVAVSLFPINAANVSTKPFYQHCCCEMSWASMVQGWQQHIRKTDLTAEVVVKVR